MLSAEAYSFRQKSRLAISLSWVAGYTNIVAFIATAHTISHMSGNTTVFSFAIGSEQWDKVAEYGSILASFLIGSALAGLMTELARRRGSASKYVLPIAVEAILLITLGIWLACDSVNLSISQGILFACIAALTMGLQNATITHISGAEVRTTHVTGVITDLGLESIQFLFWWRDKIRYAKNPTRIQRVLRLSLRHPTFLLLLLLASILGSFGFGVVAGTLLIQHLPKLVMIPPVLFLLWIILVDWRKPIADVRELDLLGDPELQFQDIFKELLPTDLAIYRITQHRSETRPPHFRAWAQRIPRHRRIIILAFSPLTRLTDNAILDLLAAAEELRQQSQTIILANISDRQFHALRSQNAIPRLGRENILPDLEFALARALAISRTKNG